MMRARWLEFGYAAGAAFGGDPVNMTTGNFVQQTTDMQVPGVAGFDFVLIRFYNGMDTRDGAFGTGWSSLLDTSVTVQPDDSVDVRYPDGHGAYFEPGGAGYTPGDASMKDTLEPAGTGFKLTTTDQIVYTFDAQGYLVELSERHGNRITFARNGDGRATSITDSAGRVYTLTYEGDHVTAISDPAGRSWSYAYDGTDLISFTDANGGTWGYAYENHRLTRLTDPLGQVFLHNSYDAEGRVTAQIDGTGGQSAFSYSDTQTIFTDNEGNQTTYTFDDRYRVTEEQDALGQTEQFTYADDDTRTAYTDKRGNTWTYRYDDQGNLLSTTDPTGVVVSSSYNATNDLISITDQGGPGDSARTTSFVRTAAGDITRIERPDGTSVTATYDNRGQMRTLTAPNGSTTSYAYDSEGNLDITTDALGQVTAMEHDAVGRMTSLTDGNGHTVQMSYDGNDNITALIDPKGQTTSFTYDGNNSLIELVDRRGGVTTYTYDANLKLLTETDPEGHTTTYSYDAMYNRISMTDARGNVTQYRYDAIYQVTAVEDALGGSTTLAYDPNGNVLTVTNALGHTTSFAYDPVNRPTTITDALAGVTTLTYDAVGRVTRTTNPRGAVTSFAYDLLDRRTTVTDALAGVWLTGYDANGNITSLTDANGHTTGMTYDTIDQRMAVTDPEGHTTQFGYDAVGNTTVITNARGFATFFTYDANDNLATMTDALAGVTTLTYDAEDTVIASTDANGHTTQFAYDLDGMLIALTEAGGQVSTFAYDATHNLTRFTNAKGNAWIFAYDELNRRISATDPLEHTTRFSYDAISRLTHETDANRITTRYDYDALDRLIRVVQHERPGAVSDYETNVTTRYSYDPVGNLVALQDANGHMTGFSYDLLDRMTQEVNPLQHTWRYAYDPVGNRTQRTDANGDTTHYRYAADDLLTRISYPDGTGVSFAYDAVHNQTVMTDTLGVTRNVYDPLDRMISSTNHVGQSVGYEYDPVGNRTALVYPDGRAMRYTYDPTNYMITATDPDGLVFDATRDPTHNIVRVDNPNDTFVERDIDAAERLTAVRNSTNQNPHEIISSFDYTLDPVGNRTRVESEYRWKNLPTVIDYDYTYDPLYRLTRSEDNLDHFTAYGYDAVGNRISMHTNDDPSLKREIDAETTTYSYNDANQVIESVRAVEPRGNPDRELQTAQLLRAFVHEVTAQRGKHIETATAATLIAQATTLFSALESNQAPDEAATDTALADLRAAVEQAGEAEQIDNAGIVTSLLAKLRHAEDANARRGPILHVTMYDYDRNGNRIQRITPDDGSATQKDWLRTDYFYDYENRLEHVQDFHTPGVPGHGNWLVLDETMIQFDGYGRVFRRQHDQHIGGGGNQEWVDYVYDGLDPIAEYDNPSPQYVNYYRGYGHILSFHAFKSQQSPQGTLSYLHYDGLDSVTGITKHSGQSVHNLRYHDYGIILDINGKAADASNFTDPHNHYTFTGQEWDEHTELYHFYAREYEPSTGVWLQQDPYRGQLTAPKTLHRYGYVGQNPATYRDWYGYFACGGLCIAGIAAVVMTTVVLLNPTTSYAPATDDQVSNIDELVQNTHNPIDQVFLSTEDFLVNYETKEAVESGEATGTPHGINGSDKYFHCMANCQAARRGSYGRGVSIVISEVREAVDQIRCELGGSSSEDCKNDCDEDRKANALGRDSDLNTSCSEACQPLLDQTTDHEGNRLDPNKIPEYRRNYLLDINRNLIDSVPDGSSKPLDSLS